MNKVQELIRSNAKSKATRDLIAMVDKWHEVLSDMNYRGLDSPTKARLESEALAAIKRTHADALALEKDRILQELDLCRERFEREYDAHLTKNAFNIANYERRCRAMTEKEVLRELNKYNEDTISDPVLIDILSSTLAERGMTAEHASLREFAQKNNYDQPHLLTKLGKHLQHELALVDPVSGGGVRVEDSDGRIMSFTYSDLLDDDIEADEVNNESL